ncbi:PTS sugar transporter subunit IIA [Lactobacillus sp. ESL0731]|uniref:PTS sugar transporter subunit IIA n=1 Tax=unclassified Lactobacillus TaxID=2620435 RepID=UPI0023F8F1FE|nr:MULTISPECIES: PTS sugar transporter subunit IIA [unclassified Lactobacillus]WEV51356.1 PTS sugar transporter subunit IIA [Lactobacillus sp. ESL0700]WEV62486.1 PTS sugar transporter subunit IIA [Lactobacillus sp. ESL0731]
MFYENLIDLNVSVSSEEQLFDLVGLRAINLEYANLGYITSLEKRELSYPTGLKFPKISLALPHVDPQYVKRPFIYIARTTQPLKLRQMGDNAEITASDFLFLGLKNGKKQPELLSQIISAFQDENFVGQFKGISTTEKMLQLVERKFEGLSK